MKELNTMFRIHSTSKGSIPVMEPSEPRHSPKNARPPDLLIQAVSPVEQLLSRAAVERLRIPQSTEKRTNIRKLIDPN
jgi:hypothetical protein